MAAAIPIKHDTRRRQLERLVETLEHLVGVLERDMSCQWTRHFVECACTAKRLLHDGFTQDQLAELSQAVCSVYQGSGSFSDYYPPDESASVFSAHSAYDRALELRVIGRR